MVQWLEWSHLKLVKGFQIPLLVVLNFQDEQKSLVQF